VTLEHLRAALADARVSLARAQDGIRFRAPAGALTRQMREEIGRHREALMDELRHEAEVKAFEDLDVEVLLNGPGGEVWLVPRPTGLPRPELSMADIRAIQFVQREFPGAQVVAVRHVGPKSGVLDP
jgi:hypothetical protein